MSKNSQKRKQKKRTFEDFIQLTKNAGRVLAFYWHVAPRNLIVALVTTILLSLLPFVSSYLGALGVNMTVEYLAGKDIQTSDIFILLAGSLLVKLVIDILQKASSTSERIAFLDLNAKSSVDFARKVASLDIEKHENSEFITQLNRARGGHNRIGEFGNRLFYTFDNIITIISAVVILSSLSLVLLPITIIVQIPEFFIHLKGSKAKWGIWDAKESVKKRYWETEGVLSRYSYIKEIKIFGSISYLVNMLGRLINDFNKEQKKILIKETNFSYLSSLFESSIYAGIEVWLLIQVLAKSIGLGDYNFYLVSIVRLSSATRRLMRDINRFYEDSLYITDFFEILDIKNRIVSKSNAIKISTQTVPKIEFRNVTFTYPGAKKPVYKDFSLVINPGEDIALVGENGAGKTTFVKLLCRFYDVQKGEILINGVNIKEIDLDTYYKNLGVLFQDFNQYAYRAEENIALGDVTRMDDKEGIKKAAKTAGAHDFIKELDRGYKQILSKWFSKGTDLSGGQWQRIALARAFFRDANILILDEPTSAIDAKGEYEIFEKISKVQEKKTTIIISHRFSTVRKADKIYVVEKGHMIEQGSHAELMAKPSGLYKKMFDLQAEGYK